MEKIVEVQRQFFNSNATKDISFRIAQLQKLETLLRANEELLHQAIYKDFKKSAFENYTTEISLLYHDIKEAIKNIKKWSARGITHTNFPLHRPLRPLQQGIP